eukprot:SAG11_NODE_9595_length_897_cov_1.112782_2_plen_75_part_00
MGWAGGKALVVPWLIVSVDKHVVEKLMSQSAFGRIASFFPYEEVDPNSRARYVFKAFCRVHCCQANTYWYTNQR